MQAVILAGGLGTRLKPLTNAVPKPMMRIQNKPFLEYQIALLKKQDIKKIVLCIGYLHEQIEEYFGDGAKWGISITYAIEDQSLGTGGALKKAQGLLQREFLLLYGDSYLPIDYIEIIKEFHHSKKIGLMVVYDNHEPIDALNNVAVQGTEVREYNKQQKKPEFNGVEAGVLVFKKEIVNLMPNKEIFSLEEEVFPKLIEQHEMAAVMTRQRFYDIGTLQRLKYAEEILK